MNFINLRHEALATCIHVNVELTTPNRLHLCDGSEEEFRSLCDEMVKTNTLIHLNEKKRPNSFLARSNPHDVARVENRTFLCSKKQDDAGPTNNWCSPDEMSVQLKTLF